MWFVFNHLTIITKQHSNYLQPREYMQMVCLLMYTNLQCTAEMSVVLGNLELS